MLKNLKLRSKVLLILLFIALLSAGVVGTIAFNLGTNTLKDESYKKLTAIREMKAHQIENYFELIFDQVRSFSESKTIIEAVSEFEKGFYHLTDDVDLSLQKMNSIDSLLTEYYLRHGINKSEYWPHHNNHRILQYQYIVKNPYPLGEKGEFSKAADNFSYNQAHSVYHPIIKNYLDRFGYYDIFLVDADSGHIIYSVSKEVDFCTDLQHGPYRNTNIANVYRAVIDNPDPGAVCFEDFTAYPPSNNAPASFIGSSIFDGDKRIGVLIFQLPIDKINHIMTDGYEWEQVGLGESGETYLVGNDLRMRNQSRFLIQDPEGFFKALEKTDINRDIISNIKDHNSTIGLLPIETIGTKNAAAGETGTQIFTDYRGINVLSAYKPLNIEKVNWSIMSEIDESEAFSAIATMSRTFVFWFIILVFFILILAIIFARSISKPVQLLTQRASILADGNLDETVVLDQKDEIGVLADNFEKMRCSVKKLVDDLQEINQTLESKVTQRTQELNRAKEAAEDILDKSPVPLAVVDVSSSTYIRVNSAMTDFHQLSTENLLKHSTLDTYYDPLKDRPVIVDQLSESGQVEDYEMQAKRIGNGEERWVIVSIHPISYLGKEMHIISLIDITERKMFEKQLRTQAAAMESTSNAIVITNPQGFIQWVNPAFTQLTGYMYDEVIGQTPGIMKSGEHDAKYYEKLWNTILGGNTWEGEITNKKSNGELYTEEMTITPVFDDKERISQFVAIKHDITERKRLERIVMAANKRMEDELNVAKDIQMSMLPLIFPAFPQRGEIDVHADLIPAREVGGDFYDFYFLDESHFCFVVGDVSGKGVPAALMMAVTKTLLKSRATNDKSTASIVTHVNNEIAKDNDAYMFITVFIAILNTNTGEMVYSNAGHNPSFILSKNETKVVKLSDLHGPVVGAMEDMTYTESRISIQENDIIIAYTDGVTESQNHAEELYSDAKFIEFLENWKYTNPKKLIEEIFESVKEHENGAEQFDDITALAIQYCEKPNAMVNERASFTVKNKIEEINTAVEEFENFSERNNIPLPIMQKFNIAFDELLNNIITYGYDDDLEHVIEVEVELKGKRLVITIADDGIPFNPFKQSPPDTMLTVEERNVGGLGIHIVKNLMDEYDYRRNVNKNIITLVKHNINS